MKSIRQMRLFGGKSSGGGKEGAGGRVGALLKSILGSEKMPSKRLIAVVIAIAVWLGFTIHAEIHAVKFAKDDPFVGANSYAEMAEEGEEDGGATNKKNGAAAVAGGPGQKKSLTGTATYDRLKGVIVKDDGAGPGVLERVYHLLGGPLREGGRNAAAAASSADATRRHQHQQRRGAGGATLANVPLPFMSPWQYGLRAPEGMGGGEDAELLSASPQGSPQHLVAETPFLLANGYFPPSSSSDGNGGTIRKKDAFGEQLDAINQRYYDATDLLAAYQHLMGNQNAFKGTGNVMPVQEARAHEDELPIPHQW